ncbi:uncharacterized protein LOC125656374 [Ostrea edulis]|uniref:uncharacterized protein LOC125656374 n=1 Tax=Ostrea edulis TaxID=37623 RepID=UPI00209427F5|nr:uncharacterized protein LOC125656374 [Ostrea edulis]
MRNPVIIWMIFPVVLFMEPFYVIPCYVSDVDIQRYQREFEDLVSNGIGVIYVNVSSPSFENISLTQKEWNKIIDWIWVTEEYKYFLSYPIDIDVFTLGLMKRNVRSLKMNITIETKENCTSDRLWIQVYEYLFEVHNRSDGQFCHRYFEDQDWKKILSQISHASIGYGFHCFQNNDSSSPVTIEKSPVIYITIATIFILFAYYPLILSPSSQRTQGERQLIVYNKADYPYTPRRLFLYIIFKTGNMHLSFSLIFFLLYNLLLQKILQIKDTNEIEIKHFDDIVRYYFPVPREIFFLFAKLMLTSFLLIIMYLTLNELNFFDSENSFGSEKSFDLNTFLLYIFVLLTPGVLGILFF